MTENHRIYRIYDVNTHNLSNSELIYLVKSDPKSHFEHLMKRYENQVFVYVFRIMNQNKQNAEDVCCETWLKCYRYINQVDPEKSFISWIYKIAHNQSIDFLRKNQKFRHQNIDTVPEAIAKETEFNSSDTHHILSKILSLLKPTDRSILTLHYLEEKTIQEISQIIGILPQLVSLKLFRAKKRAQKIIQSHNLQFTFS